MPFVVLTLGILLLLLLIIKFKLNTYIALIVTAVVVGIGLGMPLTKIATSIQNGIGSQLGELALVFGFGAMLGRLVADAGGAYTISTTLLDIFGRKRLQIAIVVASFIIGIALFFEVGIVLLIPIVFAIAIEAQVPVLYLGIPMGAALSVTHGFLPPHPAPTAIATTLNANVGHVLLFGIIIAIPTVYIAGPLFSRWTQKMVPDAFTGKPHLPLSSNKRQFKVSEAPGFGLSVLTALFPVILMTITTVYELVVDHGVTPKNPSTLDQIIRLIGAPGIAMLISLLFALWSMGIHQHKTNKAITATIEDATKSIAMLLLIIGGGGAFKQILIDGGVGKAVAHWYRPRPDGNCHRLWECRRFSRERRWFLDVPGILRPDRQANAAYMDDVRNNHRCLRSRRRVGAQRHLPLSPLNWLNANYNPHRTSPWSFRRDLLITVN
ncbi:gluconate permease [Lactiplantibacillus plantarum]|nr:gluconate permease [Lactiplantibacillus plantarum]